MSDSSNTAGNGKPPDGEAQPSSSPGTAAVSGETGDITAASTETAPLGAVPGAAGAGESALSGAQHDGRGEVAPVAEGAPMSDGEMPELDLPEQATTTSFRLPTQVIPAVTYPPLEEETAMVRPYMLTGGRTKAKYALELETLVSANKGVLTEDAPARIEHRSIMEACPEPRSVAEIASNLRMPLGVARVLVSDAADAGLITVHKTISGADGAEAHLLLMERVLSGLRRL